MEVNKAIDKLEVKEPEQLEEMEQGKGLIITIVRNKGFGFIRSDTGEKVFFHAEGVCNPTFEDLKEGYTVEYMIMKTPKGLKAIGVVAI